MGEDESLIYEYWFSIESTDWRKLTVPWCDFMPVTPQAHFLNTPHGGRPSNFTSLRFGKYVWRRDCPAYRYTVAQICLEPEIAVDAADYTPATGGTPRLLAKLQAHTPISIVTIGDSLTDPRHWANREIAWTPLLATKMNDVYKVEVSVVHASMGGARLTEALTQTALWQPIVPEPDLITVWFGPNEHWNKVMPEHFRENLRYAVDHLRRVTRGKSEVLLFTCFENPGRARRPGRVRTGPARGGGGKAHRPGPKSITPSPSGPPNPNSSPGSTPGTATSPRWGTRWWPRRRGRRSTRPRLAKRTANLRMVLQKAICRSATAWKIG